MPEKRKRKKTIDVENNLLFIIGGIYVNEKHTKLDEIIQIQKKYL